MFSLYILQSEFDKSYYVGHTDNIERRFKEHNNGKCRYTGKKTPWILVYKEEYFTRSDAMKREYEIKKQKRRSYIERLINTLQ